MTDTTQTGQAAAIALTYSAEALERELLAESEDFTSIMQRESVARLFGKSVTTEMAAAHRDVRERLASPFSVMITGDFKRGKSTLINALIGQEAAPVDVQPETISINRIEFAEAFTARLHSKDGGEATLAKEDLKRERLEPLLRQLSTPLRHLVVGVNAEMLRSVTLIDTPGLGDVFREFEQVVREYMEKADMIVYVLSATSPLSSTEQDFLLSTLAPHNFPKVFFLVNAVDVFNSAEDERRVVDLIRGKLSRIMPGSTVYAISALDEWSRVSGGTRPNPNRAPALEQSFAAFRQELDEAIRFRQRYFVLDRATYAFAKTVALVEQRTAGLQSALLHDKQQLDSAVHAIEERQQNKSKEVQEAAVQLEKGFEALRREAEGWMSDFIDRLDRECFSTLPKLPDVQIRQHLPFFLKDRLRKAVEACLLSHEQDIASLFEKYTDGMEAEISRLVQTRVDHRAGAVPEQKWTNLQTAELLADLLQVGLIIQVGMALFSRHTHFGKSKQIADALTKNLPELRDEVRSQVRTMYTKVKDALVAEWNKHNEEELKGHLEDLNQAIRVRESGGGRVDDAQAKLAEVIEAVQTKKRFLEQFRPKVWSGLEASVTGT